MEVKNILITGSAGYIGYVLVNKLLAKGYNVTGIDTLYFKKSLLKKIPNYKFLKKDVRNISPKDLENIDAVIHLAALSNDALGEIKKDLTHEINYLATIQLAKKCKKAGVKRFIFSSSCSIYGIATEPVVNENSTCNPLTTYAHSKFMSEKMLQTLSNNKFTVILLRNATVYGFSHSFRDDLVVNTFAANALVSSEIRVKSDGTPWRPLIDIRDLTEIFIQFLSLPAQKINGLIVNVGFNENNFQVKDLLKVIKKQVPGCDIIFTGEHNNDSRSYKVNFDKLHAMLPSYSVKWDLEKSVNDLLVNLKKYNYTKFHFRHGKYTRIATLKKLLKSEQVNDRLFWQK